MKPTLIAWDFDGVLNRNIVDGKFVWATDFEADWGAPLDHMQEYMFRSGRFADVLVGRRDLLDLLTEWMQVAACARRAEELLDYWFERDALLDPFVLELVRHGQMRQIIATNNEARRAAYIMDKMGMGALVERMFAAGPMGVAKPEAGFFRKIEDWAGLSPGEILLIDDHPPNIAAADARGWRTFHFTEDSRHKLREVLGL